MHCLCARGRERRLTAPRGKKGERKMNPKICESCGIEDKMAGGNYCSSCLRKDPSLEDEEYEDEE